MISFSTVSRHVPVGLCFLLMFHVCLAQLSPLQKPQQCVRGRSECQIDRIIAREPNRVLVSEAGVSEFWDSFGDDELECAGVEAVRHTINPKGLLLPYYPSAPELVYVVRGRGLQGTVLPGCPETFETSFESEGGREQVFDKHQRVYRYKEGDVLALPAGTVQWTYNDGDTPIVTMVVRDISNVANQLDSNFRKFFLAGNPQSMQLQQGSRIPGPKGSSGSHGSTWQPDEEGSEPWWQPGQGQPGSWSPGQGQPGSWSPGQRQPGSWSPGQGQPGSWSPGQRQPGSWSPGQEQPGSWSPDKRQPGSWQPSTQPGSTRPSEQPWSTQPGSWQPGTQPGSKRPSEQPSSWQPDMQPGSKRPSEQPWSTQPGSWQPSTQPGSKRPSEQPWSTQPGSKRPSDQPWSKQPGSKQPSEEQPWSIQPGSKRPSEQPWSTQPESKQPSEQPWSTQPGSKRPSDQPWSTQPGSKHPSEQPWSTQPGSKQPSDRPWSTQPGSKRPSDQPWSTQPESKQPSEEQPWSTQPGSKQPSDRPWSTQPGSKRPSDQPWSTQPGSKHPSDQPWSTQPGFKRPSDQPWSTQPESKRPSDQPWSTQPGSKRPSDQPWSTQPESKRPSDQPWSTQPGSKHPSEQPSTQPGTQPGSKRPSEQPWSTQPGTQPGSKRPSEQPWSTQPGTQRPSEQPWSTQPGSWQPGTQPGSKHPSEQPGSTQPGSKRPSKQPWSTRPGQEDPCEVCRRIKGERGEAEPCANYNDLWSQEEQGQEGYNIFTGFDDIILEEIFKVQSETINKLKGVYDDRGLIVNAENFQVLVPEEQKQQKSSQGGRANGIEQTLCSTQLSANIAGPARADVYNPRGGRISSLNSHKLPVLNSLQLSAERGVLYKNAVLAPHYNLNAHSIVYIISGSSRLQIVKNNGTSVFDDIVHEGQLIVVPQDFAVIKKAGDEGCEWVAFKTNDNAITTQLAGRFSFIRALPEEVLLNSYDISREQAKSIKYSRQEGVILSPRKESTTQKAKNALLTALFG